MAISEEVKKILEQEIAYAEKMAHKSELESALHAGHQEAYELQAKRLRAKLLGDYDPYYGHLPSTPPLSEDKYGMGTGESVHVHNFTLTDYPGVRRCITCGQLE